LSKGSRQQKRFQKKENAFNSKGKKKQAQRLQKNPQQMFF